MLCITVAQDGSGDFASISEAVLAVPYDCPAQIRIGAGIYREKLVCEKKDIALQGAGADCTFRSYTAFFSGERLRVEDLTIENDAGPGAKAGQAVAAYVDSAHAVFEKVRLLGNQDTLFCAPLPEKEREKDGLPHSWVTAPSGSAEGLGFVFWDCDFVSDSCPQGTVYLGRPWRPTGKTAVLASRLGAHIAPEGFAGWNDRTDSDLAQFAEAGNTGAGACPRGPWVQALDETQAGALLCAARRRCCPE